MSDGQIAEGDSRRIRLLADTWFPAFDLLGTLGGGWLEGKSKEFSETGQANLLRRQTLSLVRTFFR
jgi:hypothetical protein